MLDRLLRNTGPHHASIATIVGTIATIYCCHHSKHQDRMALQGARVQWVGWSFCGLYKLFTPVHPRYTVAYMECMFIACAARLGFHCNLYTHFGQVDEVPGFTRSAPVMDGCFRSRLQSTWWLCCPRAFQADAAPRSLAAMGVGAPAVQNQNVQ